MYIGRKGGGIIPLGDSIKRILFTKTWLRAKRKALSSLDVIRNITSKQCTVSYNLTQIDSVKVINKNQPTRAVSYEFSMRLFWLK